MVADLRSGEGARDTVERLCMGSRERDAYLYSDRATERISGRSSREKNGDETMKANKDLSMKEKERELFKVETELNKRGWTCFTFELLDMGESVAVWDERYDKPLCFASEIHIGGLTLPDIYDKVLGVCTDYIENERDGW